MSSWIDTKVSGLRLREATIDDVELILDFIKDLAAFEKMSGQVVATPQILRETLFGSSSHAYVVLAYLNEKPIAFALYFFNFSTFTGRPGLYLEDLFVKESGRGKGVGTCILSYLASIAQKKQCTRFEWVVLHWNTHAIEFYKSLGADLLDEWKINRVDGVALEALAAKF